MTIVVCMAGSDLAMSSQLQAGQVQVGRFSMHTATPTVAQTDLLATVISIQMPERVQTVGAAVRYLLQHSGYRLAAAESIGPDTTVLLALPLPAVHRRLGPMSLKDALATLAGPAFRRVHDPVHRLIAFERCAPGRVAFRLDGEQRQIGISNGQTGDRRRYSVASSGRVLGGDGR